MLAQRERRATRTWGFLSIQGALPHWVCCVHLSQFVLFIYFSFPFYYHVGIFCSCGLFGVLILSIDQYLYIRALELKVSGLNERGILPLSLISGVPRTADLGTTLDETILCFSLNKRGFHIKAILC